MLYSLCFNWRVKKWISYCLCLQRIYKEDRHVKFCMLLLSHFSHVQLCVTPYLAAHQAMPSLGLSRQEHWSVLPFPSPMHENKKWKWKVKVKSLSHVWFCDPMDCSLPGSSVHGIFQARVMELCIPTMIIINLRTYVFEEVLIILSATKGPNRRVKKDLISEVMLSCCYSVAQSHPTLCNPMDCNSPGFPVLHHLPEFAQTHVYCVSDAILCCPLLLLPSIFPIIRVFFSNESTLLSRWPKYWTSNSASVLPVNIHGLFPLALTGWISLQSKGLSRVFSSTGFNGINAFMLSIFYYPALTFCTWLLEKP